MELDEKIKEAEQSLRLAADLSDHYYNKPLIICYSGGKDSDVMLDIARQCLNPSQFEVLNSHTTVDAPETVYYIRDKFKELGQNGIKTEIRMPKYKGEPTSMWRLIENKRMPPTRIVRYCCRILKETATPNRIVAVGVRESESAGRKGRDTFALRAKRKDELVSRGLQHTYAMFRLDQIEGAYECQFIQGLKKNKDAIVNPIYKFTDADVWDYIRIKGIKVNPLYSKGYKRVGCIGCPMAGEKGQIKEFIDYPIYKKNYTKAFDRMLAKNKRDGHVSKNNFENGEQVMRWWLGENPKQVTFDDLEKEGNT